MNLTRALLISMLAATSLAAEASFLGITVTGQLSDPYTTQLFDNGNAVVDAGEEFTGSISCCGGSTLQYYADVGEHSVTIGIRHLGPFGFVFNANAFTWQIGGLDGNASGEVQGFQLGAVFAQVLWPDANDPNAKWVGWGQNAEVPPLWDPQWNGATNTLTIVATNGFTIPPNFDVFATFDVIVPVPPALPLMLCALGLLVLGGRRRTVS